MKLILWAALMITLVAAPAAIAGYGMGNERLDTLYDTFVAPCCWRENLNTHDSPTTATLRQRIADMVEAGRSDDEIKMALTQEYGKRILIVPEGSARLWLFRAPWLLAVIGLGVVGLVLRRMRHAGEVGPSGDAAPGSAE